MPTCDFCNKTFPNWLIIEGKRRNLSSRKYCLDCSPFEQHNTRRLIPRQKRLVSRKCVCGETDPSNFYGQKTKRCAKCHNEYTKEKGQQKRNYAIEKLGGKCTRCAYNEYRCSLEIHHTDPSKKDPNFSSMRGWCNERIDKELEHCVLLCANCHHAKHADQW
jgi:hypothetical protein